MSSGTSLPRLVLKYTVALPSATNPTYNLVGVAEQQLAHDLLKKWTCHMSYALNYIKTMTSIALVRATHQCLQGSQFPSRCTNPDFLPFEDGTGLAQVN
eukprot:14171811-Ditylum_brightwellii.AAC.1